MDTVGYSIMPPQGSTVAPHVDSLFYLILYISIFFFVLIVSLSIFFVLRYRRRGEPAPSAPVSSNLGLELFWTIVPTVLVTIIFLVSFRIFMEEKVTPKDALEIKVTGQRWMWTFEYPNGVKTMNEMVVPMDRPVELLMSSTDVIHSFFVPDFRIKMDVLPNRYTVVWFQATMPGDHQVYCTQYCGTGHSEMLATVRATSEEEYASWLESQGGGGAPGVSLVDLGKQLYQSKRCVTCHSVDGSPLVGPTWKGLFGSTVELEGGGRVPADENYLRESILSPGAKIVKGFPNVMPTYQGLLTNRELDALVEYMKSLGK